MTLQVNDAAPSVVLESLEGIRVDCTAPGKYLLIVMMRYVGCPVCQLHVAELSGAMPEFAKRGVDVWVLFQSSIERLRKAMADWSPGFYAVADPGAEVYKAFDAETSFIGWANPRSLVAALRATAARKVHGRFEGRETQMPADFIIRPNGRLAYVHYGRDIGDYTRPLDLLAALDASLAGGER